MRQGWPASQLFILQEGAIAVKHDGILVEVLQAGDTAGEDALLMAPSAELLHKVLPAYQIIFGM